MSRSPAYERFLASRRIDYERWREGVGYDLDAFAAMTPAERDAVAAEARALGDPDWRDLEVLGAHGSGESFERLRDLLASAPSARTRAQALGVLIRAGRAAGSVPDVQLARVIDAIDDDDDVTPALELARSHGGPRAALALLRGARDRPAVSLHFAAALLDLAGASDDLAAFDPRFRPTLLRLLPDNAPADRAAAFAEVCRWLAVDPAEIPPRQEPGEHAWAERHLNWPRRQ